MPCVICEELNLDTNTENIGQDAQLSDVSLKHMLRVLINKVNNIELQLGNLATIDSRLESLEAGISQCVASQNSLSTRMDTLASKTSRLTATATWLQEENAELAKRLRTLENQNSGPREDEFLHRLEALEKDKLGPELILFGVRERPNENIIATVKEIGEAIGIKTDTSIITDSYRIPAKGDRPRPIIVRFVSREQRNSWLENKRAKGVLNGSDISLDLSGSRIDVNERLTVNTRELFRETKCKIKEGKLLRSWIRNGNIYIKKSESERAEKLRDLKHLWEIIKTEDNTSSTSPRERTGVSRTRTIISRNVGGDNHLENMLPDNSPQLKSSLEEETTASGSQGRNLSQAEAVETRTSQISKGAIPKKKKGNAPKAPKI